MAATFEDYDAAIRAFWAGRDLQAQKQIESGKRDAGTRGSVTGGQHLNPMQELIAAQFSPLLKLGARIRHTGRLPLPGYYRRTKDWDVVVTYNDVLVAAIECKSQVGSFGNNFNNRIEEAIGNASDLRHAYDAGLVGAIEPWLGFVMILEHAPGSTVPVRDIGRPLFRADPAFDDSSYATRYRLLFQRLVREKIYDATCFILTKSGEGIHSEPAAEVSTHKFTEAIAERVAYIQSLR